MHLLIKRQVERDGIMTNFEFYKDEILELVNLGKEIGLKNGKPTHCGMIGCYECDLEGNTCVMGIIKWLYQEYEPNAYWKEVEVDTPILVSSDGCNWVRRYFAKYENGEVYVFPNGTTSWTYDYDPVSRKYAKLNEVEE